MLFRAVSWSMGFILIAKGDSKMFILTAVVFNILSLGMNVLGYYFYGLEGLGISFLIYYIIHFIALKVITKKRYNFYFESDFYILYLICIAMCITTFALRHVPNTFVKYSSMLLMALLSLLYVLYHLNKKMELKSFFNTIIKKKNDQ
tara:strand:+ start:133 stop:573 length:441 start_codon:yes stop_codon:yes gene_type:complete